MKSSIKTSELISIEVGGLDDKTLDKIRDMKNIFRVDYTEGVLKVEAGSGKHNVLDIVNILQENGYAMRKITSEQPTLNDVFLELTGKDLRDE